MVKAIAKTIHACRFDRTVFGELGLLLVTKLHETGQSINSQSIRCLVCRVAMAYFWYNGPASLRWEGSLSEEKRRRSECEGE